MADNHSKYYLPSPSGWPLKASIALICITAGTANWFHGVWFGPYLFTFGLLMLLYVIYGWFSTVIDENRSGLTKAPQVERSFRWGMCWFIFSEVMFFGAFFAALFYVRLFVVPTLGDVTSSTHLVLWPTFKATWPLFINPNPLLFVGPQSVMETWSIPALNTLILLTSGATITVAHWSLIKNRRNLMLISQLATICLGITFLILQAHEYGEAYLTKGLTLASGIYGTTFFMLTGFHGLHVTIGTIALCAIFYRMLKRDFDTEHHFAFVAVSWYWHFVDVVWLFLFVFVYWL